MRRRFLALWLAFAAVLPAAAAERHALLIGVSSLPALPRSAWLDGPRHDVPAMRNALLAQGFPASRIVSLADGVDGASAPTRGAILAQLARFGKMLRPDDVLVIYWSGHGILMPGQPGLWQTPSGQQVHLLAQDARIDARSRQLSGSVSSADIGRAIDALAARRIQVVALFDSCHAAGSTRGDAGLVWRGLAGTALGWSPRTASIPGRTAPAASTAVAPPENAAGPRERPLFIGFFAAEPQQRSAEALASDYPGQARGMFTRALIAGLRDNPASYLAWASLTNQYYRQALDGRQLPASARPSPVYAGALEQALWTAADTPVLWPVRQDERGWHVPYGRLDGLQAGDVLQRGAGTWRVTEVGWNEARLAPPDKGADGGGWARRLPAAAAPGAAPRLAVLERRRGTRTVDLSLPGRGTVRLRVPDGELAALRARAASIAAVLALPSTAGVAPLLQARIEIQAPGKAVLSLPFVDRDLGSLAPGTRLRVIVEGNREASVDAGIVHLPLTGPATRVFPAFSGDSSRLPPAAPPQVSRFEREFEVTAQGAAGAPEWLAMVAAPAVDGALPRRFAVFDALRKTAGDDSERGAALPSRHGPDRAQVARLSWQVASGAEK
ncbi:caspase family protein [Massilia alkalitolerans]|uniref:caspase family protein n=1 Tax=Massilia alkalitolerans TaxID=286638 RepID=UPI0004029927|nr:caspase family protein [Massilia alkalitolerans]